MPTSINEILGGRWYDLQVSANNVLKHRTLPTRLTTHDNDLWQVDRVVYANG